MYSYVLLFARVQKVTPAVLRDKRQDPSNAVLCLATPSLFRLRSWLLPTLRAGPSRQLMSCLAIVVLLTDSHSAFDNISIALCYICHDNIAFAWVKENCSFSWRTDFSYAFLFFAVSLVQLRSLESVLTGFLIIIFGLAVVSMIFWCNTVNTLKIINTNSKAKTKLRKERKAKGWRLSYEFLVISYELWVVGTRLRRVRLL